MSHNHTEMAGAADWGATRWSVVLSDDRAEAVCYLAGRYWGPLYAFVRRKWPWLANEDAKDVIQEFFCKLIANPKLLDSADPEKGRFRNLLQRSLQLFAIDQWRRGKKYRDQFSLEAEEEAAGPRHEANELSPDQAFVQQEARELVESAIRAVRAGCLADGRDDLWAVFDALVVGPTLRHEPRPKNQDVAERLGIPDTKKVSNLRISASRRFAKALRSRVRGLVADDSQVDQYIQELMTILAAPASRSR